MGCPDVKHNHNVTSTQRILLGIEVTKDVGVSVEKGSIGREKTDEECVFVRFV